MSTESILINSDVDVDEQTEDKLNDFESSQNTDDDTESSQYF